MTVSTNGGTEQNLTVGRTLQRGATAGQGTSGAYNRLREAAGEPHMCRLDLAPAAAQPQQRRSLLHLAHVTDMHILDPASPGRFEFVDRFHGPPELHILVPSYRPQEIVQLHVVEAMLQTIGAIAGSPITGAPVGLLLCTGDFTDNAQHNELERALRLWTGGAVSVGAAGRGYDGVASPEWGDDAYWHPDEAPDQYKTRWGFPTYAGLLDEIARPLQAQGVALPWLTLCGNHDALVQGTAIPTPAYERILRGTQKPRLLPDDFALLERLDLFIPQPEAFLTGPTTAVPTDPDRRTFSRREFVQAWAAAGGKPPGHGFGAAAAEGVAYYVRDDYPGIRLIALDTVNRGGHYQGSIGAAQAAWLEQRLSEVHSRYRDAQGRIVTTGHADRLVVVCAHHGLASLVNDRAAPHEEDDLPRVLGAEVEALLHRFPNVVLLVNGHTHRNAVRPRPHPDGAGGFWEVTTSSLMDWPCQARLVELVANGNGTLSVFCTMVDHAAPADPRDADGLLRLAAVHRELAANDPHAGIAAGRQGEPADRNVELVIPAPFPFD